MLHARIDEMCQICLLGKHFWHVAGMLVHRRHRLHCDCDEMKCKLREVGIYFDDQCCMPGLTGCARFACWASISGTLQGCWCIAVIDCIVIVMHQHPSNMPEMLAQQANLAHFINPGMQH